jgi:hypothetical protein
MAADRAAGAVKVDAWTTRAAGRDLAFYAQ